MSDVVIRAEGLGKKYLIGHQSAQRERYTTLRDVVGRSLKEFGRSARDMLRGRQIVGGDEVEELWALKDVSFEINRGEVVGIVGRNGAGKSTLLKIISRITEPTAGHVEIRGRVASLLEVGTGFHPELSGRENIYLNGAILGMSRTEISSKFDEIVAFAEVERFLDTPVKRYSSGMYVRLAFAVAAHLEPEILIVDEVLAVGDAVFQKKCLGKMHDVAGGGRTVLFVSHNMAAVKSLCNSCVLLEAGSVVCVGKVDAVIHRYLSGAHRGFYDGVIALSSPRQYKTGEAYLRTVSLLDSESARTQVLQIGEQLVIQVEFDVQIELDAAIIEVGVVDSDGRQITQSFSSDDGIGPAWLAKGMHKLVLRVDQVFFPARYSLLVGIHKHDGTTVDFVERALDFEIINVGKSDPNHYRWSVRGYLRPHQTWQWPDRADVLGHRIAESISEQS